MWHGLHLLDVYMPQVARELRSICDDYGRIGEVQCWMHGNEGGAVIGKDWLTISTLKTQSWQSIHDIMIPNGLWWFRTCYTMNGDAGRQFATTFAHHFGDNIRVAGHTKFIHAIHAGLVVKHPGHDVDWGES